MPKFRTIILLLVFYSGCSTPARMGGLAGETKSVVTVNTSRVGDGSGRGERVYLDQEEALRLIDSGEATLDAECTEKVRTRVPDGRVFNLTTGSILYCVLPAGKLAIGVVYPDCEALLERLGFVGGNDANGAPVDLSEDLVIASGAWQQEALPFAREYLEGFGIVCHGQIGWRELRELDDRLEEILDAGSGDALTGLVAVLGAVLQTETSGEWAVLDRGVAGDREERIWSPIVIGKNGVRYDVLGAVGKILYGGEENPSLVDAGEVLLAVAKYRR